MAGTKTTYVCSNCGHNSPKWVGKCPQCGEWNTYQEEVLVKGDEKKGIENWDKYTGKKKGAKTVSLNEIEAVEQKRIITHDSELNRVLGGGIVPGSIVLVAGEPGIGKSTLFLQAALNLKQFRTLYISGEESEYQIKLRANRLKVSNENFYLLTETNTATIFKEIKKLMPQIVIIDSIQTITTPYLDSTAGSISQIRESAGEFQRFAKETNTPVFLIGHITKDGSIAGPKLLEHTVDAVLQFEGDRNYAYRILRTLKNRFGSTSEIGIYEMNQDGMRQVANPSEILLTQREEQLSGVSIAATLEGIRPLLIEVQALVTPSVYGTPQRTNSGFDLRRLQLLLAVLEKRGGFQFSSKDVFINIAGGIKIEDPSMDLAVLSALLSSYDDIPLPPQVCFSGEVGLSGEIRAVNRIEQRISEAAKLGFQKIVISKYNQKIGTDRKFGIEIVKLGKVEELYHMFF